MVGISDGEQSGEVPRGLYLSNMPQVGVNDVSVFV
jgi:hypothetical protein